MEDIYDLFEKVRDHPDYVFGAIFTTDDLREYAPEVRTLAVNYSAQASDALVFEGWGWLAAAQRDASAPGANDGRRVRRFAHLVGKLDPPAEGEIAAPPASE